MLRIGLFASTIPLLLLGVLARGELGPASRPCIALGDTAVQIAATPWQAQLHVGFTDDPTAASVRVQIVESAEAAEFVVVDDDDTAGAEACGQTAATRAIGIATSASASAAEPVIYLSRDGDADYRIFVKSRSFTTREAAALIVGANGGHPRIATAALAGGS
jgi:hypothetical protein